MAVAVDVAHEGLQEGEEPGAGQVSGSSVTCLLQNWGELMAGDCDDEEDDYGPHNQSHRPEWPSDDAEAILPEKKFELAKEAHHQWRLEKRVLN